MGKQGNRQRHEVRRKVGTHTSICVVCNRSIPRKHVAMWVVDKWTGKIFGAHMHCADGPKGQKALKAGLKAAMTTPEWIRFRFRQMAIGQKRTWATFAARWSTSRKMVG